MGNIANFIDKIKHAIYGKDVRDSIAKGIQQCYDDAIANGHTDMEVVQARKTYSNLNARLDAENGNVNNAIQTEKNNRTNADNNLQNQINSLASGSPKGVYATTAALVSANPDTGVYVVTADGHVYSWTKNGSSAMDLGVYQATEIEDESITQKKLNQKLIGNVYHIIKTGTKPTLSVIFDNPWILSNISNIKVKFKIKNIGKELKNTFSLSLSTIYGSYRSINFDETINIINNKIIDISMSKDIDISDSAKYAKINLSNGTDNYSGDFELYIYDIEFYLDDILVTDWYLNPDSTTTFDESEKIAYLASQEYVNRKINEYEIKDKSVNFNKFDDETLKKLYGESSQQLTYPFDSYSNQTCVFPAINRKLPPCYLKRLFRTAPTKKIYCFVLDSIGCKAKIIDKFTLEPNEVFINRLLPFRWIYSLLWL
ncbi:MAG: hypothetical protein IJH12_06845 [Clostridia bacterium]|nr:hypothetical protein [Clostridia bacterium]